MKLKDVLTALAWPVGIFVVTAALLAAMSWMSPAKASGLDEDLNPSPACIAVGADMMEIMQYRQAGVPLAELKAAIDGAPRGTAEDKEQAKHLADLGYAWAGGDNVDFAIDIIKKCMSGEVKPWSFLQEEEQPVEQPDDGKHI